MADERNGSETERGGGSDGTIGKSVLEALRSKELLVPAALSAAGAVAAAKGPDLVRRLTSATEEKGEEEAERLGERTAEGAKKGLEGDSGGFAGKLLSKATPG